MPYVSTYSAVLSISSSGWSNYTFRQFINKTKLTISGNKMRLVFMSPAGGMNINKAYINYKGTGAYDFVSTPIQITFDGGSTSKTVATGVEIVTDAIDLPIDGTKDIMISIHIASVGNLLSNNSNDTGGRAGYYKAGDSAALVTNTGYVANSSYQMIIKRVEIFQAELTSIFPNSGPTAGGTSVTLTGAGFIGYTSVNFGGVPATSFVVVNDTTITCVTPAHALGLVTVEVLGGPSTAELPSGYEYTNAAPLTPDFTSITPNTGATAGGQSVTIVGDRLTGVNEVRFGGAGGALATSIVVVNDETITCVTPAHASGLVALYISHPTQGNILVGDVFTYFPSVRASQIPLLIVNLPSTPSRITQVAVLIVNEPVQGARLTQAPVLQVWTPVPIPLPAPIVPDVPVTEIWQYATVINISEIGKEQRSSLRINPRINMSFSALILDDTDRRDVYQMLFKYINRLFNYPLYSHSTKMTAPATIGATKLFFDPTQTDMRVGEALALFDTRLETTRMVSVASVDADGATLTAPLAFDVPAHWLVCPAPLFRTKPIVGLQMRSVSGDFSLELDGAQTRLVKRPGQSGTLHTKIGNMILLDKRPLADTDVDEEFNQNITWLDNDISSPLPRTGWSTPFITGQRQYMIHRPIDMDYWRSFADDVRGRQKPFLLPTFRDDLPLFEIPALGATEFKSTNVQFFDFWRVNAWRYLHIQSQNGVIVRRVVEVLTNYNSIGDPGSVTIKLNTPIGAAIGDNVDIIVSYVNIVRLDSDEISMEHYQRESVITLKVRVINE